MYGVVRRDVHTYVFASQAPISNPCGSDANGIQCTEHWDVHTGLLATKSCMSQHTKSGHQLIDRADLQEESWSAFWASNEPHGCPPTSEISKKHYATSLIIGRGVEGIAFFDNKFNEPHVALARCRHVTRHYTLL